MNPLARSSRTPVPALNKQQADLVITKATDRALSPRWGKNQETANSSERPRSTLPWLNSAPHTIYWVFSHTWKHRNRTLAWEVAGTHTEH